MSERIKEKINLFIESQFSDFFRTDGAALVSFVEYYYEWLEESGNVGDVTRSLATYNDVDQIPYQFIKFLKNEFMADIPSQLKIDQRFLIKNILDFYRAKGSESAYRLLFRILFDEEIEFYYPGKDILRASDGKWVIDRSLRLSTIMAYDLLNQHNLIKGLTSKATAKIDRYEEITTDGVTTKELFITDIRGNFVQDEEIANRETGEVLGSIVSDGIVVYPGRWLNTDGFLSSNKFLQDNDYYQEYSYEITSTKSAHTYKTVAEKTVHPAGTKMFGKVVQRFDLDSTNTFDTVDELILQMPLVDVDQSNISEEYSNAKTYDKYLNPYGIADDGYGTYVISNGSTGILYQAAITVEPGDTYTTSVDAWSGNQSLLTIYDSSWGGASYYYATFNVETGEIVASGTKIFARTIKMSDDKYRCIVSFTIPLGQTTHRPKIKVGTFTGDNTGFSLNIKRAQLEKSPYITNYIPTTDTAITYGTSTTNFCLMSEDLANASYWTGSNNVASVVADAETNPDGVLSATQIDIDTGTTVGGLKSQPISVVTDTVYTVSAYFKHKSGPYNLRLIVAGSEAFGGGLDRFIDFDGRAGTFIYKSPEISSYTIVSLENGWYRVSGTFTATATDSTSMGLYASQNITSFYGWGAQFEISESCSMYVPTLDIPKTRLGGSNFFTWSDDFSNSDWTKYATTVAGNLFIHPGYTLGVWADWEISLFGDVPIKYLGNSNIVIGKGTVFTRDVTGLKQKALTDEITIKIWDKNKDVYISEKVVEVFSDSALMIQSPYLTTDMIGGYYAIDKTRFDDRWLSYDFTYYPYIVGTIRIVGDKIYGIGTLFTQQLQPGDFVMVSPKNLDEFLDLYADDVLMADVDNYFRLTTYEVYTFRMEVLSIQDDLNLTLVLNSHLKMENDETMDYGIETPEII